MSPKTRCKYTVNNLNKQKNFYSGCKNSCHPHENQAFAGKKIIVKKVPLDKSAQSRKIELGDKLLKRNLRKFLTTLIVKPLLSLKSKYHSYYLRTYHCCDVMVQKNGKIRANHYCNSRFCLICNGIRTAKLINAYLPVIEREFKEKYFVTLTVPNVKGNELKTKKKEMYANRKRIIECLKKRVKKGKLPELKAIFKFEITYNKKRKDYHPHFHAIVNSKSMAKQMVDQWLKLYPEAKKWCQNIKKCNDKTLKEIFKYFSKLVKYKKNRDGKFKFESSYPPEVLDTIMDAVYKGHLVSTVGIRKQVSEDIEGDELEASLEARDDRGDDIWVWDANCNDWLSLNYGDYLNDCKINEVFDIVYDCVYADDG